MSKISEKMDSKDLEGTQFPICNKCLHWEKNTLKCDAFDKIPGEILNNDFIHTKPFKGDNGIMFETIKKD